MPDDKILSRRLNHLFGHCRQGVDFENPLNLSQEPIQQPEVAASDSDDRRGGDRINGVSRKSNAWRCPVTLQKLTNLARRQRTKLVYKADAGVELRIASQALFKAWHPDQNHSNPALIENASCLLQPGDLKPVGFVDDQQGGRIGDQLLQSHRAMLLLEEGVFGVLCLLTAIPVRILETITKVIENTKEPLHFRILNLTPHINGSTNATGPGATRSVVQ